MLQIIAIGIAFLIFGIGSITSMLGVIATPVDKRTRNTGLSNRIAYAVLGLFILALAVIPSCGQMTR